ncbi:MAG: hypothetical protein LBQ18_02140 [Campylobacteraceae bacterium]|jgi:Flp pilus assembly protein TadD|nr:hypothetical protein [Campylobacteraceae bacterium]
MRKYIKSICIAMLSVLLVGCATNSKQLIMDDVQQVQIRSYQTREYDQSKQTVSRAVISALQDLGFIADKVDMGTGTVTATKLASGASLKMTVVVRSKNEALTTVRANAQFSSRSEMPKAVDDPEVFKAFFTALDKAVFLEKEGL